jgi:hypothetical protein
MKMRTLLIALGIAVVTSINAVAGGLLSPKAAANQSKVVRGYNPDPNLATGNGLQSAPPHVVGSKEKIVPGKSVDVTSSVTAARHLSGSPKMIGECVNRGDGTMSCCAPAAAPIK